MADNSRIEDLRKRYHENPRRFFAPLANEYRKSGFLDRALLLCQKHVPEQPENMNGLVVYGQILFEMGQPEAARDPFEQALKLDPENLIALRHLGDIARGLGDVPTAKGWYEKVLELDRRNDEVLDLMAQLSGGDAAPAADIVETPSARPSTAAAGLISVAPNVSVSTPGDGFIDLGEPAAPPPAPKPVAGKGSTVVINAQALADRDRREADAGAATPPAAATPEPVAAEPPPAPRPSKRASLLDIDFDFSETVEAESPMAIPQAPVLGTEAAEYGFSADALIVETTGDVAPLAGLETTEFTSEQVAPMSDLESDSVSMSMPSVAPLAGLDRPEATVDEVAPIEGLDAAMDVEAPSDLDGLADLPLLEEASAGEPIDESPSERPKPRMTKADLASLPLLADFGLDDDPAPEDATSEEPASAALAAASDEPSMDLPSVVSAPRVSKATPTFVTETMAALYVQQGLFAEAIGVYRQLVAASPGDAGLQAKLAELERMHAQEQAPAATDSAAEEMPEFEAPLDATEPEPAPANAAMDDVSFGAIALQGQGSATPIVTPAVAAGPSAREFFGGFARRVAVVAAAAATATATAAAAPLAESDAEPPTAITAAASGWPLDALFGAADDVRDLHAAESLAGLGTFTGPDGGTGISDILAGDSAPRRSVPRASETLKFDQFFQKPGTASAAAPEAAAAAPDDDDLDQFQDWLKGLKK